MTMTDISVAERPLARPRQPRRAPSKGGLNAWLAARILEHVTELGLEPGTHIAEQTLADWFQVSRTPIRLALTRLAKAGAVEHKPHRGFFVASPGSGVAPTVPRPDDDTLYYRIAEDRLKRLIGERVTEAALVRRYRTSRTRIAATLERMAHEGWLTRLPGHGWVFAPMLDSVKGYEDGYRFRGIIEPAALRQPGYQLPAELIARCREQQRQLRDHDERFTDAEIFELGSRFHEIIVSGSGNPFLIDAIRRVNALRRLLEYRAKRNRDKIASQFREHMQLLDLIETGKLEDAARLMERHLDVARKTKSPLVRNGGRK